MPYKAGAYKGSSVFENSILWRQLRTETTAEITMLHIKVLCRKLAEKFDYVIIDAPAGIDDGFILSTAGADKAVIVTTPEYAAVRDAEMVVRCLQMWA